MNGLYFRMEDDIFPYQPEQVVMMVGINGIEMDFDLIIRKISTVAELMAERGIRVYLCSILPQRNPDEWNRFQYQDKIVSINAELKRIAGEKFAGFIDYHSAMKDEKGELHRDFMLKNGRDYFYYVFDLGIQGNEDVTVDVEGIDTRSVDKFFRKIVSANWLDNGTKVDFIQNQENGMASFRCTGYPYGSNTVVRVLKLTVE